MADLILGMGEVGATIFDLLTGRGYECVGVDTVPTKCRNYHGSAALSEAGIEYLHVCMPGELAEFDGVVLDWTQRCGDALKAVLLHSTTRPGTAAKIQGRCDIPVISAPTRGVHVRFLEDMKRYTKFVSADIPLPDAIKADVESRFKKMIWMSSTKTAELAKVLVDTTYYGWLINYAQVTKMICDKEGVDYDEMWTFAEEPHEYLGNRPKMYPGVIGGHCVIPNLNLIEYDNIDSIRRINEMYKKHIE